MSNRINNLSAALVMRLRAVVMLFLLVGAGRHALVFGGSTDFARDVRPLLSNHCFHCHGPDEDSREADLRLDTHEGIESVLDRDDLKSSSLIERIHSNDPDLMMPPAASNKPLNDAQKKLLREWVLSGGEWSQHWSFVRPQRKTPPATKSWGRNEIDAFALQRMEQAGLEPAADADAYTLIRRLYLDLIGLPPTPAQADQWKARIWPDANQTESVDEVQWQALVTELLESPAWGERWARRWLDLARYADTNGYEKDRNRSIWPYRDWVINALNSGMPFDQFTIEQIAGDMLPNATQDQRVATGFHRNTMLNEEGGIDPLEFRFHAMTDRVSTTGTTWLGLTLECVQCHAHKYDPISHREYYGLMAFLNNADEPALRLTDESTAAKNQKRRQQADALIRELPGKWPGEVASQEAESQSASTESERKQHRNAAFQDWLHKESANAANWQDMVPLKVRSSLPLLTIEEDGSIFATGDVAKRDDYWITLDGMEQRITAIQLEVLPDERLPAGGPGTTYYEGTIGDFFLNEFTVSSNGKSYDIDAATESWAKDRYGRASGASLTIDGDVQTGWSVHERIGERHVAVFQLKQPLPTHSPIEVHMTFGRHFASSLGRFRFSATSIDHAPAARGYSRRITSLLAKDPADRSEQENAELLTAFLMQSPRLKKQSDQIRALLKPVSVAETLVMEERPPGHSRPTYRHHRGEYLQAEEVITPMTPAVLHPLADGVNPDRLALARWLVAPENPLTARVVVNRHWAAFFGTGIVRTVNDFGLQGEFPTHPDLLDWLAVTFIEDDAWSLRKLHSRIVSSSLYRQSAVATPAARQLDPDNRLLSHSPRYRLDAEIIRDRLLVSAGVFHDQVGGPSVFPPQPAGVQGAAYRRDEWKESKGPQRYRRSLYTFSRRTSPFAMLSTFDGPSGESCIARRNRSNNPLQALTLLNDTMFTELARKAASVPRPKNATDKTIIRNLFRRVLTRPPTADETDSLLAFAEQLRASFSSDANRAKELAGEDIESEDIVDRAVWVGVARALFALDETVMRE